jgi:proline iminopeptidase
LELLSYAAKSINAKLSRKELDSVKYWGDRIADGDTSYSARYHRGLALAPAYLYHKKYVPALADRLAQGNQTVLSLVWSDLNRIHFDCASGLLYFKKPVLIIQGKQDIIEKKTALKAHHLLANSRVVILDKCGHYGWLDQEAEYLKNIEALLQSVKHE